MNLLSTGADTSKIHTTTDYKIFKLILGNRDVCHKHVLLLAKHIEARDLEIPIIVNEKMEVCDGQHRLEACKLTNKPVTYVIKHGLNLEDIRNLNSTSRKWTLYEYMMSFVKLGNEEYEILKWFQETYSFSISDCGAMLNGKGWFSHTELEKFKRGEFKVHNLEKAKVIADRIIYVGNYFEHYKKKSFIGAMTTCLNDPSFDWDIFKQRLKNFSAKLTNQGSRGDFILNIEKLYNFKTTPKKRIRLKTYHDLKNDQSRATHKYDGSGEFAKLRNVGA